MPALTPDERRGLATLALVIALGAAHDLWRARHPGRVPRPAPATAAATPDPTATPDPAELPDPAAATRRSDAGDPTLMPPQAAADPRSAQPAIDRLDLNRATAAELDALPGIGPVLAGRIVEERTRRAGFERVEDLLAVPGIGPKLFARLRLRVRVGSAAAAP